MKISITEKIGYSLGDAAANFIFQTMLVFQLAFYTDTFGITVRAASESRVEIVLPTGGKHQVEEEQRAWNEVLKAAAKSGAEKLSAEAAARLRLELPEQQPGDHFWILMDPIVGADGEPYVFYLACHDDGERRLLGRYVSPARRFFPHREIVFALRP